MTRLDPPRPVLAWPCQSVCVWAPTGELWESDEADPLAVFRCAGCGSEWVRTERWTPVDATGAVPNLVGAERARSGPSAGAADSSGT